MDGFKPLGDIKESDIVLMLVFAVLGVISVLFVIVKIVIWLINHIQII